MNWFDAAKSRVSVADAAEALGMEVVGSKLRPCPACSADTRSASEKRPPVNLVEDSGWKCHACGEKGSVIDLVSFSLTGERKPSNWGPVQSWFADRGVEGDDTGSGSSGGWRRRRRRPRARKRPSGEQAEDRRSHGSIQWRDGIASQCADALWSDNEWAVVAQRYLLEIRALAPESLRAYGIGLLVDEAGEPVVNDGRPWITIPLMDTLGRAVNLRARSVPIPGTCEHCSDPDRGCKKCRSYRVCPKRDGRPLPLYGAHKLTIDKSIPVIVVEGELDVVALHSYGFDENVVSGTAGAGSWSDEWLDLLEPYDEIIGIEDDDDAGREGWVKVATKLGLNRCRKTTLPRNDAGDCRIDGVPLEDVERAIARAEPMHGVRVVSIGDYGPAIESLFENPDALKGVSCGGSVLLDEAIGGIRPGLIIVSGETGQGKSTFLTWLSWCLAGEGHDVVLSSFEGAAVLEDGQVRPVAVPMKLLRMELQCDPLKVSKEVRSAAMQELGRLPIGLIDHHGEMSAAKFGQVIEYEARRNGVRYFVGDHLGFLLGDVADDDERSAIDNVIRHYAGLASRLGVTIFLVVHPHNWAGKTHGATRPTMYNLKGASSIRQDADEVWIIQAVPSARDERGKKSKRPFPISVVHLDKVRSDFGGTPGTAVRLAFDPSSLHYADTWEDTPSGRSNRIVPTRAR